MTVRSPSIFATLLISYLSLSALTDGLSLSDDLHNTLKQFCPAHEHCHVTQKRELLNGAAADETVIDASDESTCCLACSCNFGLCSKRGNCCPNITEPVEKKQINADQSKLECISPLINIKKQVKRKTVTSNTTSDHDWSTSKATAGVFMVISCMNGTQDRRCDNPNVTILEENTPQTSMETGVTYRNVYCALCNNITNLSPWQPYVTCSDMNIMKSSQLLFPNSVDRVYSVAISSGSATCGVQFRPPHNVSVASDKCIVEQGVIGQCAENNTDHALKDACEQLYMPFMNNEQKGIVVYANVFCYLCNLRPDAVKETTCPNDFALSLHTDNDYVAQLNADGSKITRFMVPWTQTDMPPKHYTPSGKECSKSFVYDIYTNACRQWYCPEGREMVGSDCVPLFADVEKAIYSVQLQLKPDSRSRDVFKTHKNTRDLVELVLDRMFGEGHDIEKEIIVLSIKKDKSFVFTSILLHITHSSNKTKVLFDFTTYGNDITIQGKNGSVTINADLSTALKIELSTFPLSDIVVLDLSDYTVLDNIYRANITDIQNIFRYSSITKLFFCTQIQLSRGEIRDYVDIVDVRISDVRLHVGEFARASLYDSVRVCLSDYLRRAEEHLEILRIKNTYTPQAYLSLVCSLLSITGLIFTILTYIVFDDLRSVPGKNNLMLALHLLIAQCLFQFGMDQTDTPTLCIVLGMCIHLFWLVAIFWMNACTVHMFRTFVTGQSYRSVKAFDPQVCCYGFYCYASAVCMVAINIGVSMYTSHGNTIGYGGHICYISNPVMVGWVFALRLVLLSF